jgi:aminoglycoside phosphotransferase (APT) family kinase protein
VSDVEAKEDPAQLANRVLEHHLGSRARQLKEETSGASNHVFTADHDRGVFVLRLSPDADRLNAYLKECWAIERVRAEGVPTPEVLEVGASVIPWPYMLMDRVTGQEATGHPRRADILRSLGAHAARINAIATTGFGDVFDWAPAGVARNATWRAFLIDELELERKLAVLAAHDMVPEEQLGEIRETLMSLGDAPRRPSLNHGDLRLKNVMVDEAGAIVAILDWEKCVSGIAPDWELSIALHDLAVDEKDDFTQGYGLTPDELTRRAPVLKALNVVNYAPFIEQAADAGDAEALDRYKLRLSGALDLYSI